MESIMRDTMNSGEEELQGVGNEELERVLSSLRTKICVVGCGGAGTNTITRLLDAGIRGAELYALNTDAQHLLYAKAPRKLLIGRRTTKGLGAGALPSVGEAAALEAEEEIKTMLKGADLVFVTCGLGGGTGTGSVPVVARIAKELGALTIAVVTIPFSVEGVVRMENAINGLEKLKREADTVIVVPNDKLLQVAPRLSINEAFRVADEILVRAIKGISEMITVPGLINLDFADLKTIMKGGGVAMIGLGEADSNDTKKAVIDALNSPLLDVDITNATGALVNVVGGDTLTLQEAQEAVSEIHAKAPNARIIWGVATDPGMKSSVRIMLVITGVKSPQIFGRERNAQKGNMGIDMVG
ncbi:MAG: cell division protein FtsZ [Candidatus Thermoplasmatota archaeon]|nr:cell division protein FtsZ [Candidatus Thermoplasmatota archaeon]